MQPRSEETRRQILKAAEELFARQGFDGTGVAEICAAAGVSKGAFYHHFPSKHDVFHTLLKDWLHDLERGLETARQEAGSIPVVLLKMSAMMRQVFQAGGGRLPIFLEFWSQASRDTSVWEATNAPYYRFQAFFTRLVEEGIAQGSLRPVEPQSAAKTIVALAVGVLLQGLLDPRGADWVKVAQQSVAYFLQGVATKDALLAISDQFDVEGG
jgi:AcrR family transcriptional regulator